MRAEWIPIEVNGMVGHYRVRHATPHFLVEVKGKWVSHTGFRSLILRPRASLKDLRKELEALAEENAALPYLVGVEHAAEGWKTLWREDGAWHIRLPEWADEKLVSLLQSAGFRSARSQDSIFRLERAEPVSRQRLRAALAPVLEKGSRLSDETLLCHHLHDSMDAQGFFVEQQELF